MKLENITDIEKAIASLPPEELKKFRSWFFEFDQDRWDKELVRDITSGKLDTLAREALAEHKSGKTSTL